MSEIVRRLTRLLPDLAVEESFLGHITIRAHSTTGESADSAAALADRLERADADRAKVERVEALCNTACARRDVEAIKIGAPSEMLTATVDVYELRRALDPSEAP